LAYNLANFLRRLELPRAVKHWSLTTLREKLIKIGAKVVTHARHVTFQMAEVAVSRQLFRAILERIRRLWLPPPVPDNRIMEQMARKLSDVVEPGDQSVPNSPECFGRAWFARDCGFWTTVASRLSRGF